MYAVFLAYRELISKSVFTSTKDFVRYAVYVATHVEYRIGI